MPLSARNYWIFDMDGTLTLAAHDFEAIRIALDLPANKPILEEIAQRPRAEAAELSRRLEELEIEIAHRSRPQPGARKVLSSFKRRGMRLGILTRNSELVADITLAASGLADFFSPADIVGRESSPPKPKPDGIYSLLERWGATRNQAVIVGDYRYDLEAGRNAGVATVYFDPDGDHAWNTLADHRIDKIVALLDLCSGE